MAGCQIRIWGMGGKRRSARSSRRKGRGSPLRGCRGICRAKIAPTIGGPPEFRGRWGRVASVTTWNPHPSDGRALQDRVDPSEPNGAAGYQDVSAPFGLLGSTGSCRARLNCPPRGGGSVLANPLASDVVTGQDRAWWRRSRRSSPSKTRTGLREGRRGIALARFVGDATACAFLVFDARQCIHRARYECDFAELNRRISNTAGSSSMRNSTQGPEQTAARAGAQCWAWCACRVRA